VARQCILKNRSSFPIENGTRLALNVISRKYCYTSNEETKGVSCGVTCNILNFVGKVEGGVYNVYCPVHGKIGPASTVAASVKVEIYLFCHRIFTTC
jgi:hypothetical protein